MGIFGIKTKKDREHELLEEEMARIEFERKEVQKIQASKLSKNKNRCASSFLIAETDDENKYLNIKLLEKWDSIFQRKNTIDKLNLFERSGRKNCFKAESFSIELSSDSWKVEEITFLELSYESQEKKLFLKFSKMENSDSESRRINSDPKFVLLLEYKTDQESNNIKTEITGKTIDLSKSNGLYGFLCSFDHSDIADDMRVFFAKLEEAEQKLPNKNEIDLKEKYSSALNDLSTL